MKTYCIGANHKTASVEARERFYVPLERAAAEAQRIKDQFRLSEIFTLSTCNRTEIFCVAESLSDLDLCRIFSEFSRQSESVDHLTYRHSEDHAWRHLFEVVASLDSLVIGETQIVGQFKDSLLEHSHAKLLGPLLGRLTQEALSVNKAVRSQTRLATKTVSVAHAAIQLAEEVYGGLDGARLLLLGAGKMAQNAAKHLEKSPLSHLVVLSRSEKSLQKVLYNNSLVMVVKESLDHIARELLEADIVLCATSSPEYLVTHRMLQTLMPMRRGRSIVMVDMSIPRNIEPSCSDIEEVYLFDVDHLKSVVDANKTIREAARSDAEPILAKAVQDFRSWQGQRHLHSTLGLIDTYFSLLFAKEYEKTMQKSCFRDLPNEEAKRAVRELLASIRSKTVGDISRGARGLDADALLKRIFGQTE